MDDVSSVQQTITSINVSQELDNLGDGDKPHHCCQSSESLTLHSRQFPQDRGEEELVDAHANPKSGCEREENKQGKSTASEQYLSLASEKPKPISFSCEPDDIISEIFSNSTITEHNLFQEKLHFLPINKNVSFLEQNVGENIDGLHLSIFHQDSEKLVRNAKNDLEKDLETSDFLLGEDEMHVLLSPRKNWLDAKELVNETERNPVINANGDNNTTSNDVTRILEITSASSSSSVTLADKNGVLVSSSDNSYLGSKRNNKYEPEQLTKSTCLNLNIFAGAEAETLSRNNFDFDSSTSKSEETGDYFDDFYYSGAPTEFNVEMSSEEDDEKPGPSRRQNQNQEQQEQEQENKETVQTEEKEETNSSISSIYHAAHTESFMSSHFVTDPDDSNDDYDDEDMDSLSRYASDISGVASDKEPLEKELDKYKGMRVKLELSDDFDGDRDDLISTDGVEVDVLWANHMYCKHNDETGIKDIIIPPETTPLSIDTPHERHTSHIQNLMMKTINKKNKTKTKTKKTKKTRRKQHKHKPKNNEDTDSDPHSDSDSELHGRVHDDSVVVVDLSQTRLEVLAPISPLISRILEQQIDHEKNDDDNEEKSKPMDENTDTDEKEEEEDEEDDKDSKNSSQISNESFTINYVPKSKSNPVSTSSSSVENTTTTDSDTGDESIYDVEFMGRWDIFWPIMTPSQRRMVGAPSHLNMATESYVEQPDEDEAEDIEVRGGNEENKSTSETPVINPSCRNKISVQIEEILDEALGTAADTDRTKKETKTKTISSNENDGLGENDDKTGHKRQ